MSPIQRVPFQKRNLSIYFVPRTLQPLAEALVPIAYSRAAVRVSKRIMTTGNAAKIRGVAP